jgi:branched-chain amino acid aminotransferase group I
MTTKNITVIHCWSAPRSRSTALLYSFEARSDCVAIDEPLYREWLVARGDAVARPYTHEMIHGTPPDNDKGDPVRWSRELLSLEERILAAAKELPDKGIIFCKHMAKHTQLYDFEHEIVSSDSDLVLHHKHLLLIRDPVAVLSSWGVASTVHGSNPTPDEVGIVPLLSIYSTLHSRSSASGATADNTNVVALLESDNLVKDPVQALTDVCNDLGMDFQDSMMTWQSGPHACDGPWADWWYADVHRSTGWRVPSKEHPDYAAVHKYRTLDPSLQLALKASFPAYQFLHGLTASYRNRGPPADQLYEDPRNADLLVWIGSPGHGRLMPREMAAVSPWDSSVQGGDACWEGVRVYRGKILSLEQHVRRLHKSAKALGFEGEIHTAAQVKEAIFRTLAANGMRDGAHMRLTLTRGEKCTSSMNPVFNVYGTTLIVLAEWKATEGKTTYDNVAGISLITASQRRNSPNTVDSKIHHNNLINNILPKIQANLAGCADAIMLDVEGYVSETNATNIFMVDDGVLLTPHADACLPGITRATVLALAAELGIPVEVRRVSLSEFHSADEVFTTGTMGELTPVTKIDGRVIGTGVRGPITERLQNTYKTLPERPGWATEIPPFEC